MTTLKEFRDARDRSGNVEPTVRTAFSHCRGFSAGADWAATKLADCAEALLRAVDAGEVEADEALAYMAGYARGYQKLAASRNPAKSSPHLTPKEH